MMFTLMGSGKYSLLPAFLSSESVSTIGCLPLPFLTQALQQLSAPPHMSVAKALICFPLLVEWRTVVSANSLSTCSVVSLLAVSCPEHWPDRSISPESDCTRRPALGHFRECYGFRSSFCERTMLPSFPLWLNPWRGLLVSLG